MRQRWMWTALASLGMLCGFGARAWGQADGTDANPLKLSPHHVTASVADIEKEAEWYERVLGFKEVRHLKDGANFELRQLGIPGYRIDLSWRKGSTRGQGEQGWFHVGFKSPAIEADYKRLQELGTDVKANRNDKGGLAQLVFHDPEGNELEIAPE